MTPRNQERIFPKESVPGFGYELTQLSDFATRRRYEEGRVVLTIKEAADVLKTSAEIVHQKVIFPLAIHTGLCPLKRDPF